LESLVSVSTCENDIDEETITEKKTNENASPFAEKTSQLLLFVIEPHRLKAIEVPNLKRTEVRNCGNEKKSK
jgi:hypothetical protein